MIKKVFPILALAMFASMLGVGIVSPFLPLYSQKMGATGIWVGIIFGIFSVSRVLVMPFTGRLSDRKGRKLFLSIGLVCYAIISVAYIWASSILHLIIIRLLHGVASGMILPIAIASIGELSPKGEEGKWMGYANAAFFGGFAVGPLLGGMVADYFGTNTAFLTMASLNMLAFLLILFFLTEGNQEGATTVFKLSLKEISASRIIRGLFSYRVAYAIGRGTFMTFLAIFGTSILDLSQADVGIVLTTHMILVSVSQPYLGHFADKFSRRAMVVIGGSINFMFLALIPVTQSYWQILFLCIIGSFGAAISMPAATAMTVEEGRKGFGMASTMSLLMIAMGIGMAVGPTIAGAISDALNINAAFYFASLMSFAGTALFMWFTRRGQQSTPYPK